MLVPNLTEVLKEVSFEFFRLMKCLYKMMLTPPGENPSLEECAEDAQVAYELRVPVLLCTEHNSMV